MIGVVVRLAGCNFSLPAEDVRHANAAFVQHSFAALERRVVGDAVFVEAGALVAADAAVVAGENDERVFGQAELVERRHDSADAFVDAGDHRRVGRVLVAADGRLVFELRDQFLLRFVRRVDAEVRQIQEERLILVPLDEIDGVIGEKVGQVLALRIVGGRIGFEVEVHAGGFDGFVEAAFAG